MDESERLQRYRDGRENERDLELADRIAKLLNHPGINEDCMVDAYYYDFSVIPEKIQVDLQLWRDAYLIFGITNQGEIVSKWVDRWDLDSDNEIVDGKVVKKEKKHRDENYFVPEIKQSFDPKLLSCPVPLLFKTLDMDEGVLPEKNEIDVRNMDLCDACKNKIISEFIKAFNQLDKNK